MSDQYENFKSAIEGDGGEWVEVGFDRDDHRRHLEERLAFVLRSLGYELEDAADDVELLRRTLEALQEARSRGPIEAALRQFGRAADTALHWALWRLLAGEVPNEQ